MRRICISMFIAVLLPVLLVLAGCGGVGDRVICMNGTGTLSPSDEYFDGDYGDFVKFTPSHSARIYIAMASVGMLGTEDPYIAVYDGDPRNGGSEVASDDDSGFDYNSLLDFWAEEGVTYWVFFTSCDGDEFGDYEWTICEETALPASISAAVASPDAASDTPAKQ